jgi:hypothetical protein
MALSAAYRPDSLAPLAVIANAAGAQEQAPG